MEETQIKAALEGTARYAGFTSSSCGGFGLRPRLFFAFGKKSFLCFYGLL